MRSRNFARNTFILFWSQKITWRYVSLYWSDKFELAIGDQTVIQVNIWPFIWAISK